MNTPTGPEATSYAGAAIAVGSAMTLTEWGIVVGIVTALLTLAFNIWWGYRKDRRETLESAARIKALQSE